MSHYAPTNYAEVARGIGNTHSFHARSLNIKTDCMWVLSDARNILSGHLDDFAQSIIDLQDSRKARYLSLGENRVTSARPNDPVYIVARDGNALAYIERSGKVQINPSVASGLPKYVRTIEKIREALDNAGEKAPRIFSY